MLTTMVHEAAVDLGLALSQAPVLAAYRAAAAALEADSVTQGLLADLRERQTTLSRLQQVGLSPSQQQIDALRLCQEAVRSNATIMAYLREMNEAKAFLPRVADQISLALGSDYARLARPNTC